MAIHAATVRDANTSPTIKRNFRKRMFTQPAFLWVSQERNQEGDRQKSQCPDYPSPFDGKRVAYSHSKKDRAAAILKAISLTAGSSGSGVGPPQEFRST
jgi:hypothetical protein